ncbi:MAG: carbohydrate ABC transporter permease [Thermomicrobiales bacterium]
MKLVEQPGVVRKHASKLAARLLVYGFLTAASALFLLPFYWMIATALKPRQLVYRFPPDWLAGDLTLANFREGWTALPFDRFFINTVFVTILIVVGTVGSSSLVGFGLARYRSRIGDVLFALVLLTMMVPPAATLIPRFVIFSRLGWTNTYLPIVLPYWFGVPFFIFLFRQFFRAIPQEYFDAAELDGASPFSLYFRVAVPMARPAFVTSALFSMLIAWNDFLDPLVYLSTLDKFTIQLGLSSFRGQYVADLHLMMPMALLAMIPVLLIVALGQRWIARGLAPDLEK